MMAGMRVGRILEIWRYPVKSMAGERLDEVELDPLGIPGDRGWAVRDEVRGGIRGAKKIAGLMRCRRRATWSHRHARVSARRRSPCPTARGARECARRGRAGVGGGAGDGHPLAPPARDRARPLSARRADHADMETELRAVFGRHRGRGRCRTSRSCRARCSSTSHRRARTSTRSPHAAALDRDLEKLAKAAPASRVDVRRFRPNFVVETDAGIDGYVDADWAGRRLRLGKLEIDGAMACPRCVMVSHGFATCRATPGCCARSCATRIKNVGLYARRGARGAYASATRSRSSTDSRAQSAM